MLVIGVCRYILNNISYDICDISPNSPHFDFARYLFCRPMNKECNIRVLFVRLSLWTNSQTTYVAHTDKSRMSKIIASKWIRYFQMSSPSRNQKRDRPRTKWGRNMYQHMWSALFDFCTIECDAPTIYQRANY